MNQFPPEVNGMSFVHNMGQPNTVMDSVNLAAQRFFAPNNGELRTNPVTSGNPLGRADSAESLDFDDVPTFQKLDLDGSQTDDQITGNMQQDQATQNAFRMMRDEIMRLQRENRSLTRQLSIAQHELRTVHRERSIERMRREGVDVANLNPSQHRSVFSYRQRGGPPTSLDQ
uniref:Uncharacterized protein n=1 Tax=Cryptomonas curvata TaxID=233186 RepID=A0A7S0QJX5_9CRYP|mmetsp:Transcript_29825/g.62524  ORF Transcript_29825/g.62524 Transcript_29825/m.62524 type:complete len:172 (+) Transcript_29825:166-681(+)